MTLLQWDQVGDRLFETGIDRGVLFLSDGRAAPWNGLLGIEDGTTMEVQSHYMDGVKFLERTIPGDFSATLRAFTYPEEFNECLGTLEAHEGLMYHDQSPKRFSLCYRTLIGNDIDGITHGYRIHILYNVLATPSSRNFSTLGDGLEPMEFSWALSGIPPLNPGFRPTVHISIDSTKTDPIRLGDIEEVLYGTATVDPELPSISDFGDRFIGLGALVITNNGDGTWTATDTGDDYLTVIDATTVEIVDADTTEIDADSYTISTTNEDF